MLTADQVIATQKANVETLFGLSAKAFEGFERLAALNLQAARSALVEAADSTRALLSVKDAQEFVALQASLVQPSAEKAVSYGRHVADIAKATNAEIIRAAEAQIAEGQERFNALVEAASKNAPAGTESVFSAYKQALATATNAIESVQKAAKQATDTAQANFNAVTEQAVQATKAVSKAAGKAKR